MNICAALLGATSPANAVAQAASSCNGWDSFVWYAEVCWEVTTGCYSEEYDVWFRPSREWYADCYQNIPRIATPQVPGTCQCYTDAATDLPMVPELFPDKFVSWQQKCDGWRSQFPIESCSTSVDDNCDGQVNEGCAASCGTENQACCPSGSACVYSNLRCYGGICRACGAPNQACCTSGTQCAASTHLCNSLGVCNPPEDCGTGKDDDRDGQINEGCPLPNPPAPAVPPAPIRADPTREMNNGCSTGDWAGADPVQLALRSAVTEPFTDFQVAPLRELHVTRVYSSADATVRGETEPPGIFGLGWHHTWELSLSCSGASCTVHDAYGPTDMQFAADPATRLGVGPYAGEALTVYQRSEPDPNLAPGGRNILVRRPSNEFILFEADGSEKHFFLLASGSPPSFDHLPMTLDVDAAGRAVEIRYDMPGKLIAWTDDLGNTLSLEPSSACPSRAGRLMYRAGAGGVDTLYATYEYDWSTCTQLRKVVPASYEPAPGKSAQLRRYEYLMNAVPGYQAGLLTTIRNEFDDPVVVFTYDLSKGDVTSIVDHSSTLSITYPPATNTYETVVASFGTSSTSSTTRFRRDAGKAFSGTDSADGRSLSIDMQWNGKYLVCDRRDDGSLRYFQRDALNRVTFLADYETSARCASLPWQGRSPVRSERIEYGVSKPIAEGVAFELDAVTRRSHRSVFAEELVAAGGGSLDSYVEAEVLDYDPAPKAGDPAGYSCGGAPNRPGSLVCRRFVEGYTPESTHLLQRRPVQQRLATFFSYDARGRLMGKIGPVVVSGPLPANNVDPVEQYSYWSDEDPDPVRRGRLREVKRWPGGWPAADRALVQTIEAYDVFGPTMVRDEAGQLTVITRVGGAGRVTRLDGPGGSLTRVRYYDGRDPRVVLFTGGSAQRWTYDARGRPKSIEALSGDPDVPGAVVTSGGVENNDYDPAGNVSGSTLVDAQGNARFRTILEHYSDGALRRSIHPGSSAWVASWNRDLTARQLTHVDELNHSTRYAWDAIGRLRSVTGGSGADSFAYSYGYKSGLGFDPEQVTTVELGTTPGSGYRLASYQHDDFGRLVFLSAPVFPAGPYLFSYDARGNLIERSGNGTVLEYRYDGVNRLVRLIATKLADSSTIEYVYNYDDSSARGRLHSIDEADRTTTFTYDEAGRLRFETTSERGIAAERTTEYRYDIDGNLSDVVYPAGLHVVYDRDPATQEITTVRNAATGTPYASEVKHYPKGPLASLTFTGGATLTQTFNLRYEPVSIQSGPLTLTYGMYWDGNIASIDANLFGLTSYEYDDRERLTSAAPPVGATNYAIGFTSEGDANTHTGRMIRADEIQPSGIVPALTFAYDQASNLSAISKNGTTTCLVHDALGRLVAVGPARLANPADGAACQTESALSSVSVRFRYDSRNRRVARQDGSGPWKYFAFTSNGQLLSELLAPASAGAGWATERDYVWLNERPLAQLEYPGPAGSAEGYTYLYHLDHLGQPRVLTSITGQIVWSARMTPYGEAYETTTPDPANGRTIVTNLRLPGQYDERLFGSLGLQGPYYNWHRWYLPVVGRYLEPDPIALAGGLNGRFGPDWYGYADANPIIWTDPLGLFNPVKGLTSALNMANAARLYTSGGVKVLASIGLDITGVGLPEGMAIGLWGVWNLHSGGVAERRANKLWAEALREDWSDASWRNLLGTAPVPFGDRFDDPCEPTPLEFFKEELRKVGERHDWLRWIGELGMGAG